MNNPVIKNVDWRYLRRPIILLGAAILITLTLIAAGYQYEEAKQGEYRKALATLRSTHKLYSNVVKDIDLLDQYRSLYSDYRSSGLVGKERRLSWIESLQSTNEVLQLPVLNYSLKPQEAFERPGLKVKRGVEVQSSPMDLSMGLLHEEDLFAVLQGLRESIKNLFTVDSCVIRRQSNVKSMLDTKRANLRSNCTIRWVTIDAK